MPKASKSLTHASASRSVERDIKPKIGKTDASVFAADVSASGPRGRVSLPTLVVPRSRAEKLVLEKLISRLNEREIKPTIKNDMPAESAAGTPVAEPGRQVGIPAMAVPPAGTEQPAPPASGPAATESSRLQALRLSIVHARLSTLEPDLHAALDHGRMSAQFADRSGNQMAQGNAWYGLSEHMPSIHRRVYSETAMRLAERARRGNDAVEFFRFKLAVAQEVKDESGGDVEAERVACAQLAMLESGEIAELYAFRALELWPDMPPDVRAGVYGAIRASSWGNNSAA